MHQFAQSRLLWKHDRPAHTQVEIMRRMINRKHHLSLCKWQSNIDLCSQYDATIAMTADYHDLHKYSVEDYSFWLDLWEFLGIISSVPPNPKQVFKLLT